NVPGVQVVFIDTPGLHKPKTELGRRLNQRSLETFGAVDVVCFLVEATGPIGSGDRFINEALRDTTTPVILVVNKVDAARPAEIAERPGPLLAMRAVVRVERDSQKAIVIGQGGSVIKAAGTAARQELEALLGTKVFLETHVKVDKDWQRRPDALDRLGY